MENNFSPRQRHLNFLATVRAYELSVARQYLPGVATYSGQCRLLELGAGTGAQAKQLSDLGYKVTALEVAGSHYRNVRCFDILEYDGVRIPLPDCSHDVVFSSHVLEHVINIDDVLKETHRVLSDEGICVHLIPTPACRIWTLGAHYIWLARRIATKIISVRHYGASKEDVPRTPSTAKSWLWTIFPPRHGERGNSVTEVYYYSKNFWKRKFDQNNFDVIRVESNNLFYTMSNSLGQNVAMSMRRFLAPVFGSACHVFVLKKKD